MKKYLIVNKGCSGQGKSASIKELFYLLKSKYPVDRETFIDDGDIKAIIKIENFKIGIESQGDPNSRLFKSMDKFIAEECDIIVTACRTRGETLYKMLELQDKKEFNIIWAENYRSDIPSLQDIFNSHYAKSIAKLIYSLINEK